MRLRATPLEHAEPNDIRKVEYQLNSDNYPRLIQTKNCWRNLEFVNIYHKRMQQTNNFKY